MIPILQVRTLRKSILVTKMFEDLKIRLRRNRMDMYTNRKAQNNYNQTQQTTYMRLEEGLLSGDGKVYTPRISDTATLKLITPSFVPGVSRCDS